MGIPPLVEVVVSDVHSAGIAYLSVEDDDLLVVPAAKMEERVMPHLDAVPFHAREETRPFPDVHEILHYVPHFQGIFPAKIHGGTHQAASRIPEELEILHMDVIPGIHHVDGQKIEFLKTRPDDPHRIAGCGLLLRASGEHLGQWPELRPYPADGFSRAFRGRTPLSR